MHYLSVGAIFHMENSWLEEWIQYHQGIGVEHFYLYDDGPESRVSDRILKRFVDAGIVEHRYVREMKLNQSPRVWRQQDVYKEILRLTATETEWLALIDLDEFLLPRRHDDLRATMEEYDDYSGLAVHWSVFGTSGHVRRPGTQINHLLHRAEEQWERNQFVKSIVKPRHVKIESIYDVHHFPMREGVTVNERHKPVNSNIYQDISTDTIRLNHYILRSWQDYWEVKARRARPVRSAVCDMDYFDWHDRNECYDDEIAERFGYLIEV